MKSVLRVSILCFVVVSATAPSVAVGQANRAAEPANWLRIAQACVIAGNAEMIFEDDEVELFAFSCGQGRDRDVFMLNLSDEERRVQRNGDVEPLIPIFSSSGDIAAIPSIVITLPGDGTVLHENSIPPRTLVVFRPIRQHDIRPRGLDE